MADASKFSFGGTTYTLKDAAARTSLAGKIDKVTTMPSTPTDEQVVMFVGDTTTDYTKGHFYQYSETDTEWVDITPAGGTVDQTYDSTSTNAQSGTAVAEAVAASIAHVTTMPANPSAGNTVLYVGAASGEFTPGHVYTYRSSIPHYALCLKETTQGVTPTSKYVDENQEEISNPTSPTDLINVGGFMQGGEWYGNFALDGNGKLNCTAGGNDYYPISNIDLSAWPDTNSMFTVDTSRTVAGSTSIRLFVVQYVASTGPGWEDITPQDPRISPWEDASNWFTAVSGELTEYAFNITNKVLEISKVNGKAYLEGHITLSKTEGSDQIALLLQATNDLPTKYAPKKTPPAVEGTDFGVGSLTLLEDLNVIQLQIIPMTIEGEMEWDAGSLTIASSFDNPPSEVTTSSKTFRIAASWRTELD